MIKVTIKRSVDRSIIGFTLSGHAEYDEPGKDIVCAGVTAVAFGTVNSIEALLKLELNPKTPQRGHLEVEIPDTPDAKSNEHMQLLLESMVVMLKGIASSYGKYVKLKEIHT